MIFDNTLPIVLGSDHAGFALKKILLEQLTNANLLTIDVGCYSTESVDYPDIAHEVATYIENQQAAFGILVCGSGVGVSISANKHVNIRAALCWDPQIATLSRQHNNANIICLPARFINAEDAKNCLQQFMNTPFEGGRHELRVNKIELSSF